MRGHDALREVEPDSEPLVGAGRAEVRLCERVEDLIADLEQAIGNITD